MDAKTDNYPQTPSNEFPFKSLNGTLQMLDCSKFYLYKLIRKKVITPYYFEVDEKGEPSGKPYFKKDQIIQALKERS